MTAPTGWDVTGYYAAQLLPEQAPADTTVRVVGLGIVPPRPLQLGDFLGGAFRAVRYSPVTMFGVTLMAILVAQLVAVGVGILLSREFSSILDTSEFGSIGPLAGWTTIISYFTTSLATVLVEIGLTYAVHEAVFARRTAPSAALRRIGSRAGATLGFSGLILLVLIVVAGVVALFASFPIATVDAAWWLLLIPVIVAGIGASYWLGIRLILVLPVIAIEEVGPFRAIRRSWQLTKGQFWRYLGILLLANVLISMATNVISTVFTFAAALIGAANPEVAVVVAMVAAMVATMVFYVPLSTAVTTLLYTDARIRHEGHDLQIAEVLYG
jgi:hypothetical protein